MSLDLVAVQRDAALLDALAQRGWPDNDVLGAVDPVERLLAALAADVDEGLVDVAGPGVAPLVPPIPAQGGRRSGPGTVSVLARLPAGRRHAARVVAAIVVTAAVLSVSGVAAAVTGDPLRPYKRVFEVVRGGYDDVAPKSLAVFHRTSAAPAVPRKARGVVPSAATEVQRSRDAVVARAPAAADGRQFRDRHKGDRAGWGRVGADPRSGVALDLGHRRAGRKDAGTSRASARSGHQQSGQHRSGFGAAGGAGQAGQHGRDPGWRGARSGDPRR